MKLTDLNIDCLENILEYLKFGDFLSAASSNKRLNKAANFIFVRKHSQKLVHFEKIHISRCRSLRSTGMIAFGDLKSSLQFIRCFGHLISEIRFLQKQFDLDQHVINYINEHCSDSLKQIRIVDNFEGWEHLQKPFSKVEKVALVRCHVADKDSLYRLFPKMLKLECCFCSHEFLSGISNHFPNLESLIICDRKSSASSCHDSLPSILRLNPQLKSLRIVTNDTLLDSSDLQNAIRTLQNLESLTISVDTLCSNPIDSAIHLENVKEFYIYYIISNDINEIPFSFGQLERLNVGFPNELNAAFFSFIEKHPTVKYLILQTNNLSAMDQLKIAKSLPLLAKIEFNRCTLSANEAAQFMSNFQNLKYFTFNINEFAARDVFRALLSNDWECDFNGYSRISVERRVASEKKRKIN